jgi:hypothetical protein
VLDVTFIWSTVIWPPEHYMRKSTNCKRHHDAVFSLFLLLLLSEVRMLSSAPSSQAAYPQYMLLPDWETKFQFM